MFSEHEIHEMAVMNRYRRAKTLIPAGVRIKRFKAGCHRDGDIRKLQDRVRKIYPRGPALERMMDII